MGDRVGGDLTPYQINAKLRELVHAGEELLDAYRAEAVAAAIAEAEYRSEYARELLLAEGSVEVRKAEAMVACEESGSMMRRKTSEAIADATKQALFMNRTDKSVLQTMLNQLKDEMRTPQ